MKAKSNVLMCVLLGLCLGLGFAQAKKMTAKEFLDSYEKFVVSVEKAAEKGDFGSYMKFYNAYLEFAADYSKIDQTNPAVWTLSDTSRYLDLTNRYSVAIAKLSGMSMSAPAPSSSVSCKS